MPRGVFVRTVAYRAKMSIATRNRTLSEIARMNIRRASIKNLEKARVATGGRSGFLGHHHTEAAKQKLRLFFQGKRPITSPEIIRKISATLKGRPNPLVQGNRSPLWKHGLSATREYIRQMKKRRTAFERGGGSLSTCTVQLVYEDNIKKYGTLTCIYCLMSIPFGQDTLEHKQPLSRGGTNDYENLAVACLRCNSRKRAMLHDEYIKLCAG